MLGLGVASFYLASDYYNQAIPTLHPFIRRRVNVLKRPALYNQKALSILQPILREFRLHDLSDEGVAYDNTYEERNSERSLAASTLIGLIQPLRHFLIASENRLHLALDIEKMRKNLQILSDLAKASDSRAHLAELTGIFSLYDSAPKTGFVLQPNANDDAVALFKSFVRNAHFSKLQDANRNLGFAGKAKDAIMESEHRLRQLVAASPFRAIVEWSSKLINVATGIPMPGSSFAKALIRESYLPPIVSVTDQVAAAQAAWLRVKPSFVPTGSRTWKVQPQEYLLGFGDEYGLDGLCGNPRDIPPPLSFQ
jgi:hypothetical protein